MNKVLLYLNEVLVSLDIPPLVKASEKKIKKSTNRIPQESLD